MSLDTSSVEQWVKSMDPKDVEQWIREVSKGDPDRIMLVDDAVDHLVEITGSIGTPQFRTVVVDGLHLLQDTEESRLFTSALQFLLQRSKGSGVQVLVAAGHLRQLPATRDVVAAYYADGSRELIQFREVLL